MELERNYAAFEALDAEIVSIAQLEKDPAMLPRITEFVHNSFPIVADPEQITREPFEIFGIYLVDKEGVVRTYIPGTKEARPRLDIIITELAKLAGKEPPPFTADEGRVDTLGALETKSVGTISPDQVLAQRWMWSHNRVRPGDDFKLAFMADIAPGYHVYGHQEARMTPFNLTLDLPEGITLVEPYKHPRSTAYQDPVLDQELYVYENVIAMPVIFLRAAEDLAPGAYSATATVKFQACNASVCHPPTEKVIELPLTVVGQDEPRLAVAGSDAW